MTIGAGITGGQTRAYNGAGSAMGSGMGARVAVLASADTSFRQRVAETLSGLRWQVREARGGAEAIGMIERMDCAALLLDSWLPDLEVGELAARMRASYPGVDIVLADESIAVADARGGVKSSRRNELLYALRRGAAATPGGEPVENRQAGNAVAAGPDAAINALVVAAALNTGVEGLQESVNRKEAPAVEPGQSPNIGEPVTKRASVQRLPELVGESPVMLELSRLVRLVAPRTTGVLIEGPTGSGKELVARAVHRLSARVGRPLAVLNCAAIPEPLLEAELFGHTRGAFTGAVQARTGRVEAANGGTLFLDEIGEMPLPLQSKLLRFLESGELQRVGENDPVRVDVRVIAATNEHLLEGTRNGRFRADLYYRLAVFPIATPALKDHAEDIPLLANFFLSRMAESQPLKRLSQGALDMLMAHAWPGNVRELQHVIERAYILAEERLEIDEGDICIRQTART